MKILTLLLIITIILFSGAFNVLANPPGEDSYLIKKTLKQKPECPPAGEINSSGSTKDQKQDYLCNTSFDEVKVTSGSVRRFSSFPSNYVAARNIDVWLPDGYTDKIKYNVIYMHDGQMLFDSTTTWNKLEWGADETLSVLIRQGKIAPCILVAIWNTASRHSEYFPQKPFESLKPEEKEFVTTQLQAAGRTTALFQPESDNYLKFVVNELKPFIDKNFSTYAKPSGTFIAGSSMGGLISLYAICEYPDVFGGAACISTHWPGVFSMEGNPVPDAFFRYMECCLPSPKKHKLYFDYGDQTLDALYPPLQKEADEILQKKGFSAKNWQTRFFPGKDHSEWSWNERLEIPILFLLGK